MPSLSFAQERMWFLEQMHPGNPAYVIAFTVRMPGSVESEALHRALFEVTRRHDALRTAIRTAPDGTPYQYVAAAVPVGLPSVDLDGHPAGNRAEVLAALLAAQAQRPFDLGRPPLLRATRYIVGDSCVLFVAVHHIVFDAWSLGIFLRELAELYAGFRAGVPAIPPEPQMRYAEYAEWQRRSLADGRFDAGLRFWRSHLRGAPTVLDLPTDAPRPAVAGWRGGRREFTLAAEVVTRLHAVGAAARASQFMVLLAGFAVLLSRWSGQRDLVVGTAAANRPVRAYELVGCCVNTLPIRVDLSGAATFAALLDRVRSAALAAYDHQEVPFERLVAQLRPDRDAARAPIVQAALTFQNAPLVPPEFDGSTATVAYVQVEAAKFDISLSVTVQAGRLHGVLAYNADLFTPSTVHAQLRGLTAILEDAATDPGRPLDELGGDRWAAGARPLPRRSGEVPTPARLPRTDTEVVLAAIWTELLGVVQIGVDDDFEALGGGPPQAARMVEMIEEDFGVRLPAGVLGEVRTVAAFAARIDRLVAGQFGACAGAGPPSAVES